MYNRGNDYISQEHMEYLKKVRIKRFSILLTQILILVLFLGLWEAAARLKFIDPFITSQPSRIFSTLISLYREGQLFEHIGITCMETVVGFSLGTVLGIIIAVILWWSEFLSKVFEPYLVILNSLPKIALGPIFIVWIGAGPISIIAIVLTISIIVTILEILNGFLGVDPDKIKLAKTFGANKFQIMMKVVLPSSLPVIMNALKVNVGLSWVGVIVGEFLISKAGIGYLIVYGGQVFQLDLVMTSVFILAAAAYVMYRCVAYVEKLLVKNKG
ncbi:ABC transporter permease [Pseudobacteroides cellulosolvens]|uniref:ABC-type transporter, integral membrane subunit n=1 Tax=Pseudobacteroides cellulosolvens ATCC 35603 = DSM 2933 TaxID=398512 RepID=A0A0L6JQA4_9FIRM|nr:ABC transporter permease [Pseudobacteroides cellulosolvens]KNY28021.1 ABC-type transporter, integral membrane subunit [Pseudobacteroides cellulosolvens ATCC 35603 = DSM 2933]